MKTIKISEILSACHGEWIGNTGLEGCIDAVVTDSRKVTAGCMFVAIQGENLDGHDFVLSAINNGAACAIVEKRIEGVDRLILVPDTVCALQEIAAFYRSILPVSIVGITGSVGKTTAKEIVASVLAEKYPVYKTQGNYNNDIGVPLTLFGIDGDCKIAVVEMGVSHPGDMLRLARMVRPDMMLYTVIGDAHLEYLKDRCGVFTEKTVANDFLPESGTVFLNGDDPLLKKMQCVQTKISFGKSNDCAVRAINVVQSIENGTTCTIISGERSFSVSVPGFGEHMVYALLEGASVGIRFGLTDDEIIRGIGRYMPVGHRARLLQTERYLIIDDCYNANPTSVASAIRSLAGNNGRKVCILGDMLELGPNSKELHRNIGLITKKEGIDLVLTVGKDAEEIALAAGKEAKHFMTVDDLISNLSSYLLPGDTILIKASRSMHFETIVNELVGEV